MEAFPRPVLSYPMPIAHLLPAMRIPVLTRNYKVDDDDDDDLRRP